MSTTVSPTTEAPMSDAFLVFLIIICIIVVAFVITIVIWGFWKYRKIKRREIERCSNCRCDTLEEHTRCRSCEIPPTEEELREAEANLIYHRCPCIPPWRSRTTKIAVNGGHPISTDRDHIPTKLSSSRIEKNVSAHGQSNGLVKTNGAVTPLRVNGAIPRGDANAEETLTREQSHKRGTVAPSPDRTSADNGTISEVTKVGEAENESGTKENPADGVRNASRNERNDPSQNGPPPPSSDPTNNPSRKESLRWGKSTPPDVVPQAEETTEHNSVVSNSVPPLELKCLNEESSDIEKGKKQRKSVRKGEDSYESSEEEISTPRPPTVIHIGKSGVTIGGSNDVGAASPRIKIGGNGSISLGNSTISLGGTAGSQINLGNHLGGSTITIGGGESTNDGKLAPQILRIGSRSSRRSGRYDGKHFHHHKSRHQSYNSGRSSTGSRCSTQISFSNGMTLVLDEEDGDQDSPRGQTQRSRVRRRHESQTSYRRSHHEWSRQSERRRYPSTTRDENGGYHHHRHGTKIHPYRSSTNRENSSLPEKSGGDRKIYTLPQPDQSYSPKR